MTAPVDRDQLIRRRDELRARLAAIRQDYQRGLDANLEEQAVQLENADVLDGIAKAAADELDQIERRLVELRRGGSG